MKTSNYFKSSNKSAKSIIHCTKNREIYGTKFNTTLSDNCVNKKILNNE